MTREITRRGFVGIAATALMAAAASLAGCGNPEEDSAATQAYPSDPATGDKPSEEGGKGQEAPEEILESAYIDPAEANEKVKNDKAVVVDVRTLRKFSAVSAHNSISLPSGMIAVRIREVPTDVPVLIMTEGDYHLLDAYKALVENGIPQENLYVIKGGIDAWLEADLPVDYDRHMSC